MRIIGIVSLFNPSYENIKNIKRCSCYFDTFIAIDDSTTNNSIRPSSSIQYIQNEENVGLCKTINRGIKEAKKHGAVWILILDQDSVFNESIIKAYRNYITTHSTEKIALLAPQSNYDRHKRVAGSGYKNIRFAHLSGCLFNVEAIKKIGLFDERLFIDGLDTDWCLRAIQSGYKLIECSEAVLDHNPAHTREFRLLGKVLFRYGHDTPERYYYQFRAFHLLHEKHHDLRTDLFGIYKYLKAMTLFDNREKYKAVWIQAKADYKARYFGKYKGCTLMS